MKVACQKLFLTQPTISEQIRSLEEQLGEALFIRKYRKLELTEFGRVILRKAESIFLLTQELSTHNFSQRSLRIGITSFSVIPKTLQLIDHVWRATELQLELTHGNSEELDQLIDQGKLDLLLTDIATLLSSRKYEVIHLPPQRLSCVGHISLRPFVRDLPASLNQAPLLCVSRRFTLQSHVDDYLEKHRLAPTRLGYFDSLETLQFFLRKGIGLSILPDDLINDRFSRESFVVQSLDGCSLPFFLIAPMHIARELDLTHASEQFLFERVVAVKEPQSA